MPRIWLDYCQFLMDQCLVARTRRTFNRALRALPITQHHRIWQLYLKFARMPYVPEEVAVRIYRRYMKVSTTLNIITSIFICVLYSFVCVYIIRHIIHVMINRKSTPGKGSGLTSSIRTYNTLKLGVYM